MKRLHLLVAVDPWSFWCPSSCLIFSRFGAATISCICLVRSRYRWKLDSKKIGAGLGVRENLETARRLLLRMDYYSEQA